MNLAPGEYVALNLIFVTLLVGSFLFIRRGSKAPTVLNLKNPTSGKEESGSSTPQVRNFSRTEYKPRSSQNSINGTIGPELMAESKAKSCDEKDLNILFNWNGHTWDAYEVLELPAGSSRVAVQKAFETKKIKVEKESVAFITAAYNAIISRI